MLNKRSLDFYEEKRFSLWKKIPEKKTHNLKSMDVFEYLP